MRSLETLVGSRVLRNWRFHGGFIYHLLSSSSHPADHRFALLIFWGLQTGFDESVVVSLRYRRVLSHLQLQLFSFILRNWVEAVHCAWAWDACVECLHVESFDLICWWGRNGRRGYDDGGGQEVMFRFGYRSRELKGEGAMQQVRAKAVHSYKAVHDTFYSVKVLFSFPVFFVQIDRVNFSLF